jgi:glycerol 3-phosphatase-2
LTDVICDLDGVIYRGETAIPGAPRALNRLIESGARVTFATNNSTRTPEDAAAKIKRITGIDIDRDWVVSSSQAAAAILSSSDTPVLVVGEEGVHAALLERGLITTTDPTEARCVVVGMYWSVTYSDIAAAADAVRAGSRFLATNDDPTYPIEGGLLPGAGSLVAAIATASGRIPEVAGKPHWPMRALLRDLGIGPAWVVGDRLDTDIALAGHEPDWTSVLVQSGVAEADDDLGEADHVVPTFVEAVDLILAGAVRP